MATYNRRRWIQTAAAATALQLAAQNHAAGKMRLGIILGVSPDPDAAIRRVHELGFPTCQVGVQQTSDAAAAALRKALDRYGVEATAAVAGGPGPEIYDFYRGPLTIGLVPRDTRAARIARMKEVSDFAKKAGIPAVQSHCGFIPENPNEPLYTEAVEAIRTVAAYCKNNGQNFRCETGQETPITLVRAIRDVGLDNVGVNFDVANLILYGKANPADAVDILGSLCSGRSCQGRPVPHRPPQARRRGAHRAGAGEFPGHHREVEKGRV